MAYSGVKIPDEIIIVEKINDLKNINNVNVNQGYVVESGNKNMLDSALLWARSCIKKADNTGYETLEGKCYTYKNGSFKIILKNSAQGSSQGGKLSFWNCLILAPDGKEFLIGINADILLEFLLYNIVEYGRCSNPIYLGRVNGNVGVFTPNMPAYEQFIEDENIRKSCNKKTANYVPGDIVTTLTTKMLYLGTLNSRFSIDYSHAYGYVITIFSKPKLVHIFKDLNYPAKLNVIEFYDSKPRRTISDHSDSPCDPEAAVRAYYDNKDYTDYYLDLIRLTFKGSNTELKQTLDSYFSEKYANKNTSSFYHNFHYQVNIQS